MNDRETECHNEVIDYETEKNKRLYIIVIYRDSERQALAEALEIITTRLG